jgi:hypothetical protein
VIRICQLLESIESLQNNPRMVFNRCPDIVHKLDKIEAPIQPTNMKFINSISLVSNSQNNMLSFEELKQYLKTFIEFTDYKIIQYFK